MRVSYKYYLWRLKRVNTLISSSKLCFTISERKIPSSNVLRAKKSRKCVTTKHAQMLSDVQILDARLAGRMSIVVA